MRSRFLPTILCAAALTYAGAVTADNWPRPDSREPAGNVVTKWNGVVLQVLPVDPGLLVDSRAFAIVHASIHDALNGIDARFAAYTVTLHSPGASVDAAVAAAARDSLIALAPSQAATSGGPT